MADIKSTGLPPNQSTIITKIQCDSVQKSLPHIFDGTSISPLFNFRFPLYQIQISMRVTKPQISFPNFHFITHITSRLSLLPLSLTHSDFSLSPLHFSTPIKHFPILISLQNLTIISSLLSVNYYLLSLECLRKREYNIQLEPQGSEISPLQISCFRLESTEKISNILFPIVRLNTRCHLLAFLAKVEKQLQATVSIQ